MNKQFVISLIASLFLVSCVSKRKYVLMESQYLQSAKLNAQLKETNELQSQTITNLEDSILLLRQLVDSLDGLSREIVDINDASLLRQIGELQIQNEALKARMMKITSTSKFLKAQMSALAHETDSLVGGMLQNMNEFTQNEANQILKQSEK